MSEHRNPLTVGELIWLLESHDPDAEIYLDGNIEGGASLWLEEGGEIWWT